MRGEKLAGADHFVGEGLEEGRGVGADQCARGDGREGRGGGGGVVGFDRSHCCYRKGSLGYRERTVVVDEIIVCRYAAGRNDRIGRRVGVRAGDSRGRRGRQIADTLAVHERTISNTEYWISGAVGDDLIVCSHRKIRFVHREHTRHVRRGVIVTVPCLRCRHRTRTGASNMHECAADGTVAGNTERSCKAGARCRGDAEVRITPYLIRKRTERDRLIRLADMQRSRYERNAVVARCETRRRDEVISRIRRTLRRAVIGKRAAEHARTFAAHEALIRDAVTARIRNAAICGRRIICGHGKWSGNNDAGCCTDCIDAVVVAAVAVTDDIR